MDTPTAHPLQPNDEHADDSNNSGGGGLLPRLAMSMIGGGGGATMNSAPVPDVLLSLAKDNRYISDVASLLSQVMVPYASILLLPSRRRRDDARNRSDAPFIHNDEDILETCSFLS